MNRPTVTDEMIREAAMQVAEVYYPDFKDAAVEAILRQYSYPMDGYELAKQLDRWESWDTTRDDVDAMDEIDDKVERRLRDAVGVWGQAFPMEPPFPLGTRITRGVIDHIYEHQPAVYAVKEDGCTSASRFLLIKFEDAVAIKEAA